MIPRAALLAGIPGEEESLKFGIVGGIAHPQVDMNKVNYDKKPWTNNFTQQISYISCHDDMCLVDRLKASIPGLKDPSVSESDRLAGVNPIGLAGSDCSFHFSGCTVYLGRRGNVARQEGCSQQF